MADFEMPAIPDSLLKRISHIEAKGIEDTTSLKRLMALLGISLRADFALYYRIYQDKPLLFSSWNCPDDLQRDRTHHPVPKAIYEDQPGILRLDPVEDAHFRSGNPYIKSHGLKAMACLPLRRPDQLVGILAVYYRKPIPENLALEEVFANLATLVEFEQQRMVLSDEMRLIKDTLKETHEGVSLADAAQKGFPLVYVNQGFERITGYTREEVIGRNCRFLQGDETNPDTVNALREALRKGKPLKIEILNYRKDKTPFWNLLSIRPLYNESGQPRFFLGLQLDITEKKNALSAAQQLSLRADDMFRGSNEGLITFGADGTIEAANSAALEIFAAQRGQLSGKPFSALFETGKTWIFESTTACEARLSRVDGTVFEGEYALNTVRKEDGTLFTLGRFSNIEDRIQVQKQLEEALEHEAQASRLKDQFLANISHELRTPLHAILSFAQFGLERAETDSPEKNKSYFEKIIKSGESLLHLVNDILDLAKLESGNMSMDMHKLKLKQVFLSLSLELESLMASKKLTLEIQEPKQPIVLHGDHQKLQQAFRNLLSNAFKFSPQGSSIQVDWQLDPDQVQDPPCIIKVRDHGPGIRADQLEHIFEKFAQGDKQTAYPGTGLGLSICREIIQRHGGSVFAQNHPEGGAIFTVKLPTTPLD